MIHTLLCFVAVWYQSRLPVCPGLITQLPQHDDVIKWKHFPRYWQFLRGIHRSPVNSPHNGQWRGALIFSSICAWSAPGDLRRHRTHYDVTIMVPAKHPRTLWVNEWFKLHGKYHHRKTKYSKTVWMFYRLYSTKCSVLLTRYRNRYHSYHCLIIWIITTVRKKTSSSCWPRSCEIKSNFTHNRYL